MAGLTRILYVDTYSFSQSLIRGLTQRGFKVASMEDEEEIQSPDFHRGLAKCDVLIANSDYVFKNSDLIQEENRGLKLVLLSKSSENCESTSQDGKILRCSYDPDMIEEFIMGNLDYSKLPGNQRTPSPVFYGI